MKSISPSGVFEYLIVSLKGPKIAAFCSIESILVERFSSVFNSPGKDYGDILYGLHLLRTWNFFVGYNFSTQIEDCSFYVESKGCKLQKLEGIMEG